MKLYCIKQKYSHAWYNVYKEMEEGERTPTFMGEVREPVAKYINDINPPRVPTNAELERHAERAKETAPKG